MNETNRGIMLRYHEVALKGGNRGWFEKRLQINTKRLLERELGKDDTLTVARENTRVIVRGPQLDTMTGATEESLKRVFGVTSFSPMRIVKTDRESLIAACVEEVDSYVLQHGMPRSFRVLTRRSEKAVAETSVELDKLIGSAIHERYPTVKVSMKDAELIVSVEIRRTGSYVWTRKIVGPGGLPVGTNGRLLALMSGGLDSPVAALKMLRRGSPLSYVHFYGAPFVGEEVLEKVDDLVRVLNRYQPEQQPLHVVHFGKIQEKIALATQPKVRTVLYRRMMIRIAEAVAAKVGAQALVTGESLGQVASQTLENMATINSVAALPILRPLVSFDKDEIIEEAHRLGTFDISVRPAADCCTLFADRHPAIRTTEAEIAEEEKKFPVAEFVAEALEKTELRRVY